MPACLTGKLSVRSSGPPTASAGVLIMVGAVDGSLLSAVVIGGTADNGLEIAASTIGTMTRSSSAPTTALSAARARALRRGGRTRARADAASGDGHTVGAGLHGRRSSSARSVRGMLRGRTAVGPDGSSLASVERAQAAKAAQIASEWIAGQRIFSEVVYPGSDLPPSSGWQALEVFPRAALNPNRIVHSSPGPSPELDPRGRPNAQRLF